jgi:hypothetical protein
MSLVSVLLRSIPQVMCADSRSLAAPTFSLARRQSRTGRRLWRLLCGEAYTFSQKAAGLYCSRFYTRLCDTTINPRECIEYDLRQHSSARNAWQLKQQTNGMNWNCVCDSQTYCTLKQLCK